MNIDVCDKQIQNYMHLDQSVDARCGETALAFGLQNFEVRLPDCMVIWSLDAASMLKRF